MARKISPDRLEEHEGELGIWKKISAKSARGTEAEFETILNFNFDILYRVTLGKGSTSGSGAVYELRIPGEETRLVLCTHAESLYVATLLAPRGKQGMLCDN